jgi:hypothetical protein
MLRKDDHSPIKYKCVAEADERKSHGTTSLRATNIPRANSSSSQTRISSA